MTIVARFHAGTLRSYLSVNNDWLRLMRASERNALIRTAALRAVMDWRYVKLKDRFTTVVIRPPYNYKVDVLTPLLAHGKMRHLAINGSKPYATAKTNKAGTQQVRVVLRMDYGHEVSKAIGEVMKVIPPQDTQFVADRFGLYIDQERPRPINPPNLATAKPGSLRLTRGQKRRFAGIRQRASAIRLRTRTRKTP